ncbi:MAG: flagellar filament capping protein FliD [Micromonosporaceae bacterium]|nr:flagellar filament capping protein FliD [Micromonosporaceae bacterium]
MTSSIDGLISGLSTSDLISKLMQVEASGQTRLKNKITAQEKAISSFQTINTRVAALKTAASALTSYSTWSATKATSSSDAITVATGSGAPTGKLILDMKELAQATVKTSTNLPSADLVDDVTGLSISIGGGAAQTIAVTDDTPEGVAAAINQAGLGVSALVVDSSDQGKVLQLSASQTGTANDFTVSGLNVALTTVTAAQDAKITVGIPGAGGYEVTSSTNTFTNLVPGLTITANRVENGITISTASDAESLATKMQTMVDAANALISEVGSQTKITAGSDGSTSGATLAGNFTAKQLQQSVLSAVASGATDYGSFKQLGLETTRDGKLTFNKDTFLAAYQADPTKIKTVVNDGLAARLTTVAANANTTITSSIQSGNSMIRSLNDQVDSWSVRLETKQTALQKQFANLEVALGKMQQQSSWLAGQIASLG